MVRHAGRTRGAASTDHDNRITVTELASSDELFTSPTTDDKQWFWRKPVGALHVFVQVQAGGGGGAGSAGAGGAPGGYAEGWFLADDLADVVECVVGAGGPGGPASNAGQNGGVSIFGPFGEGQGILIGIGGVGGPLTGPSVPSQNYDPLWNWFQNAIAAAAITGAEIGDGAGGPDGNLGLPGQYASGGGGGGSSNGGDGGVNGSRSSPGSGTNGGAGSNSDAPFGGAGGGGNSGSDPGGKGGRGSGGGGGGNTGDGGDGGDGWIRVRSFGVRPQRVI